MRKLLVVLSLMVAQCVLGQPPVVPPPANSRVREIQAPKPIEKLPFSRAQGSRMNYGHLAESPGLHVDKNMFNLLRYQPIMHELEIDRDQLRRLAKARIDEIKLRQQLNRELSKRSTPLQLEAGDQKARTELMEKFSTDSDNLFREVLEQEQLSRLRQLSLEMRIQSKGIVAVLSDPQMAAELGISDEQLAALRKHALESSQKFDQQVRALKRQIREDLTGVLNDRQQAQLQSMLGKKFDWEKSRKAALAEQ